MNDGNEETINTWTPNRYKKETQSRSIVDSRAESKKRLWEISYNDPRIKLQNISIIQAGKDANKVWKKTE